MGVMDGGGIWKLVNYVNYVLPATLLGRPHAVSPGKTFHSQSGQDLCAMHSQYLGLYKYIYDNDMYVCLYVYILRKTRLSSLTPECFSRLDDRARLTSSGWVPAYSVGFAALDLHG